MLVTINAQHIKVCRWSRLKTIFQLMNRIVEDLEKALKVCELCFWLLGGGG